MVRCQVGGFPCELWSRERSSWGDKSAFDQTHDERRSQTYYGI